MSRRIWNSVAERAQLNRYIELAEFAILNEDSSSSGSSSSSSSFSTNTVDMILEHTIEYAQSIFAPIVDDSINFQSPPLLIQDLNESESLHEFRFRNQHLQEVADLLWPKLSLILDGTKERIKVMNRYVVPYETGLLLVLYRLARPHRLRPDMENFFEMRKSKISAVIATFTDALYELALPYFSDPSIFQDRFRLYADLRFFIRDFSKFD